MNAKKFLTLAFLIMMIAGLLLLTSCKGGDDDDLADETDDDSEDGDTENDVTVNVDDDEEVSDDDDDGTDDPTSEDDNSPFETKDGASSKLSQLDDPLDEIEDILEDLGDQVTDGNADFNQILFNQLNVALGADLEELNSKIGELTDILYGDSLDLEAYSEEYYETLDAIAVFYDDASRQLDDLRGTNSDVDNEDSDTSDDSTSDDDEETTTPTIELSEDCVDTDGSDFYIKGSTSGLYYTGSDGPAVYEDKCGGMDNEKAYDYICEDNKIRFNIWTCENGCLDGACIQ